MQAKTVGRRHDKWFGFTDISEIRMNKHRLHEIEAGLELYSTDPYAFKPGELYELDTDIKKILEDHSIYLICTRPRISFHPYSLALDVNSQTINGAFTINLGYETQQVPFSYQHSQHFRIVQILECQKPYDRLTVLLENNLPISFRINDFIGFSRVNLQPHSDLKVAYVGQSIGKNQNSDAIKRLIGTTGKKGHGALQKVLADIDKFSPELEVYLLFYSFGFGKVITIGGGFTEPAISYNDAPKRLPHFQDLQIPRVNRIDLVEAALIRYFQPEYNEQYKKTFPKKTHDILTTLFELDITGLMVSLSTEEHNIQVYSDSIVPSDRHLAIYPIVNEHDRMSFLDLAIPFE